MIEVTYDIFSRQSLFYKNNIQERKNRQNVDF